MASSAAPTLASALLDLDLEHQRTAPSVRTFPTSVKALDEGLPSGLWTGEKLIGVVSGSGVSLSEQVICEHLLSSQEKTSQDIEHANGFVVMPHSSSTISSIHSAINDRLSRLPVAKARPNAVRYLEKVQLLQYFDFAGLTESIAEVSARLFSMNTLSAAQKTILYIEGIDVATESSQRRSGMVQANALLSSLMRTLTHLSRIHPCLLIMLDLDLKDEPRAGEDVPSAFTGDTGRHIKHQPGGVLGRTLEGALDVMIAVHDSHGAAKHGSMIVEVVKDRVGNALGQWAIWNTR